MRQILVLLALFAAAPSWASCPRLHGLYQACQSNHNYRTKLRVIQTVREGSDVYTMAWNGERHQRHVADGTRYSTPIFDTGAVIHRQASCDELGALHGSLVMENSQGGVDITITEKYFLKDGQLIYEVTDENGPFETITCRKL